MRWSSIPAGWRRSRSGCSRCAPPPASTTSPCPSWQPSPRSSTAQLAALDDGEAGLKKLAGEAKAARAAYVAAAEAQAAARRKGAARLDKAVAAELGPLKLEKAKFVTELAPLPEADWSEAGTDRVQFTVATNPGTPPAPIAQDRLGRRAVALPAGAQGLPGQGGRRRRPSCSTRSIRASAAPPRPPSASG